MPTQSLPALSLRTAKCLPAGRLLIRARNPLIYRVLWAIWRAISVVASSFLPALRETRGGGGRSAGQAFRTGRDVVEGERHRHAGVKAHQADHVGDALMAERLGRVISTWRSSTRRHARPGGGDARIGLVIAHRQRRTR